MTDSFSKDILVNLVTTCEFSSKNFQHIRSYKKLFTRVCVESPDPALLTGILIFHKKSFTKKALAAPSWLPLLCPMKLNTGHCNKNYLKIIFLLLSIGWQKCFTNELVYKIICLRENSNVKILVENYYYYLKNYIHPYRFYDINKTLINTLITKRVYELIS